MKLDIRTLAFILSLTCISQVIAIYIQYRVNKVYRGIEWWLLGSLSMSLGFIFLSMATFNVIGKLAAMGNPLLILGRICLFVGTIRFVGKRENRPLIIVTAICFISLYYYYLFGHENISARTIIVSTAISTFSIIIAYHLFFNASKNFIGSAKFTGAIFLLHGCYLGMLVVFTFFSQPIRSYIDFAPIQVAAFIVPTITSTLWTFGFILMVNQRLSAENREEKENLQHVFNAGPDASMIIRWPDGLFVDINLGFSLLSGYEREEIVGRSFVDVGIWHQVVDREKFLLELHDKGLCENMEMAFQRKDGALVVGMISAKAITINDQPHIISMIRDITERKREEAERARLEVQNRQLQKAESLSLMAGAIAHHFNNKLQTVMSNLEVLGGGIGVANSASHLSMAKQATEGAAAISRLMLVYLGQASDHRDPHVLSQVCQEALASIRATLPEGRSVEVAWPSPGPIVSANPDQIRQVVANLVVNAWEATAEGAGSIRLSLSTCPPQDISEINRFPIDWHPQPVDHACLEVADRGHGIAAADIEKVFDPFFSTKFSGRGLGLPVVLGIVQAHGGAVTVASDLGQGSVFRVYLPISIQEVSRAPERTMPIAKPRTGTILLVDDDVDLLLSTAEMIELIGHTALTAKDGIEAVEVFQRHRGQIDCVITDLTMPRMDGWATLAALRQLEPTLPVILTSGYDKAQVMSGSHPDHPQGFLGKPYGLQDLRAVLERAMVVVETGVV